MGIFFSKNDNYNNICKQFEYYDDVDKDLLKNYHRYLISRISIKDKEILNEYIEHLNFTYIYQKLYYKTILINDLVLLKDLEVKNLELEKITKKIDKNEIEIELKNLEVNLLKNSINKKEFTQINNKKRKRIDSINNQLKSYPRKIRTIQRDFNSQILKGSKIIEKIALDLKP